MAMGREFIDYLKSVFNHSQIFTNTAGIPEISGVYVVYTKDGNGNTVILDVGESGNINERISNHDRESCWQTHMINGIYYKIIPCDEELRKVLESTLRGILNPTCGER